MLHMHVHWGKPSFTVNRHVFVPVVSTSRGQSSRYSKQLGLFSPAARLLHAA